MTQLAFILMVHTRNRTSQIITRQRSSDWTRDLETISGRVGADEKRCSISSDADAVVAKSSHGKQMPSFGGV